MALAVAGHIDKQSRRQFPQSLQLSTNILFTFPLAQSSLSFLPAMNSSTLGTMACRASAALCRFSKNSSCGQATYIFCQLCRQAHHRGCVLVTLQYPTRKEENSGTEGQSYRRQALRMLFPIRRWPFRHQEQTDKQLAA